MDVYICGIDPAYEYLRLAKGYAYCYVCFEDRFYALFAYSRDETTPVRNSLFLSECADAAIVKRICEIRDTHGFGGFVGGSIIDLDEKTDPANHEMLPAFGRQLVRYHGKLYCVEYNSQARGPYILRNDYDDEQVLCELRDVLAAEGYLHDIETAWVTITEVHLLYRD